VVRLVMRLLAGLDRNRRATAGAGGPA